MTEKVTFAHYVGAGPRGEAYATQCEQVAETMVDKLIGSTTVDPATRRQAVLSTAGNLYQRRLRLTELNGYVDGTIQHTPDRPTRDPLDAARHILGLELGPGIA